VVNEKQQNNLLSSQGVWKNEGKIQDSRSSQVKIGNLNSDSSFERDKCEAETLLSLLNPKLANNFNEALSQHNPHNDSFSKNVKFPEKAGKSGRFTRGILNYNPPNTSKNMNMSKNSDEVERDSMEKKDKDVIFEDDDEIGTILEILKPTSGDKLNKTSNTQLQNKPNRYDGKEDLSEQLNNTKQHKKLKPKKRLKNPNSCFKHIMESCERNEYKTIIDNKT